MRSGQPWQRCRLGDVLAVKHGFAFKGEHFAEVGRFIVVTPGNFAEGGGFKAKESKEKCYSADPPDEFILDEGDLILALTDLKQDAPILGSPAWVPVDGVYLHNQRIGRVVEVDEQKLDPGFAYYLFCSDAIRARIRATATGATVRHTAPKRIYELEVPLPPPGVQRRIAAILSTYDELIENNARRIQILEEMAHAIYREWFVEFRYPGHENVPLVDSDLGPIPEGWRLISTEELIATGALEIGDGYRAKNIEFGPTGLPFLRVKNLRDEFDFSEVDRLPFESLHRAGRKRSQIGDCVITMKGTVGRIAFVSDRTPEFVYSPQLSYWRVLCDAPVHPLYLRAWMQSSEFVRQCASVKGLTDMADYVNLKDQRRMRVLTPPQPLQQEYARLIAPTFDLVARLREMRGNLRKTRDLLLPRLISGEIDVSELDIDVGDAAA